MYCSSPYPSAGRTQTADSTGGTTQSRARGHPGCNAMKSPSTVFWPLSVLLNCATILSFVFCFSGIAQFCVGHSGGHSHDARQHQGKGQLFYAKNLFKNRNQILSPFSGHKKYYKGIHCFDVFFFYLLPAGPPDP